ncbi:M56 family metallopeptidase [Maribellus sediminis]|uniref:M56 family metallopeptidase n=1 Tax=Maribellus sediminis TaxID=2696285 RepID=UPI00142F927C|nr:M56 family metallopeptidase [Maribellus sediminis]
MGTPTNYLIATSVCLAFTYLIYLLFFRKETNFRQRRFFLIFAAVFSLLLPTGSYYILLPLTKNAETQTEVFAPPPVWERPALQTTPTDFYPVNPVSVPDAEPVKKRNSINWLQALQYLYFAGLAVLLLRFIAQLVTINVWYYKSRKVKQPLFTLLFHERFSTTFSFFSWIFLTEKRMPEADLDKIIAHESVHVKQRHSFDAVFFELLCIFMWFNPIVWMMRRSINLTHEFLADEGAIQSGIDSLHYQALMVNQVAEGNIVSIASNFNKSMLSRRIKMIADSRLYKKAKYKILVLAPVALVLFLFIAGVNGLNQRKVLYRNLKKDPVISKVFSKDEIKDLVELRLMTDEMVINTTGESDTKIAYQKFNELLSSKNTGEEVEGIITVPHDSLVTVVKSHPALLEIYDVSNSNYMSFSINRQGKVMEFLQELSKQNGVYKNVLERIEIAGDISPSNISSFIKEPEKYNMESEAERLYASIIYGFLSNEIILKGKSQNRKVLENELYQNMLKDLVISKVFSKDEIKGLVDLRLMNDEMVVNVTGESDTKIAYQKFNELLIQKETTDELESMIILSPDVFKNVVRSHPVFDEIWHVSGVGSWDFTFRIFGKFMQFLKAMSKQNDVYYGLAYTLELAGDVSPGLISPFFQNPEKYKMETEAEKLYASFIYGILANGKIVNQDKTSNDDEQEECGCYSGIGSSETDKPSMVVEFSNRVSVSVCGFEKEKISDTEVVVSEFNVFDCKTGKSLLEYGAVNTCNVKFADGKLYITELEYLPAGENWKWESIPMMQEYLFVNGDNLSKSPRKFVYQKINIPQTRVDRFMQEVRNLKGKGYNKDFETILGRLALLALNGNMEAKNILSNFETYFNSSPDGSVAELLNRWTSLISYWKDYQDTRIDFKVNNSEVIIHDEDNYSTNFMAGLFSLPPEYKKIELRGSTLILNDMVFEPLPDYLGLGKTYKMEATDDNIHVELSFTQNTYTSIDYVVQVSQNGEPQKQYAGVAELQASFFFGTEIVLDDLKNEIFDADQFIDSQGQWINIKIGKDGLYQLRCLVENNDFKSPVLRSKNIEMPNQPRLGPNHVGDLRKMNVQTLFARLRFKSTVNFMADPDEEKFIVYGEAYGTDVSGTRLDVRNWLSYDDLKFLMDNLESQEVCKNMMSVFSSHIPYDMKSTIGGFAALFLNLYRNNRSFSALEATPATTPEMVKELKEWWKNYKNENTRYFEIGDVTVKVYQLNNSDSRMGNDFLCRGKLISSKNNLPVDSLIFNDMEAVGDRYGLNFNSQPVKGMVIGTKFGDYDGRLILIDETGKIQNFRGGFFFISKDQRYIVSPWHSDMAGITIYDLKDRKVKMDEETRIYPAFWYYFDGEYYISRFQSQPERIETDEIYRLDLEKGKLEKSEITLSELQNGEKVQMFNSEHCECN